MNGTLERAAFRMAPTATARWFVRSQPWAITPETYALMVEVTAAHEAGIRRSKGEIEERIDAAGGRRAHAPAEENTAPEHGDETPSGSAVAVIELRGLLVRHANWMTDYSGGTSTSAFAQKMRMAGSDANVRGIAIFADTPGGTVDGMQEAAEAVAEVVALGKPVVVYAECQLCSAGFGIGSQANKIVAAKRTMVGSLGVLMEHEDVSGADKIGGYAYTYVTYPKGGNKAEGNIHEPLSADTQKHYQAQIDPAGDEFYGLIAKGRGVTVARVNGWGQGRSYDSDNALALGMVDKIGTFEDALALLDELSGGDEPAGQEDQKMASQGEDPQTAAASALRESLQPGGLLAAELAALKSEIEALTQQGTAILAAQADLLGKIEATDKEALKDRVAAFVEARTDAGQIPVGEKEAEVAELLALTPELREARMARLSARATKVPTKARIEDSTTAPAIPSGLGSFAGMNVVPGEAAATAQAKAEGLSPTVDAVAYATRVAELMAEGEPDA